MSTDGRIKKRQVSFPVRILPTLILVLHWNSYLFNISFKQNEAKIQIYRRHTCSTGFLKPVSVIRYFSILDKEKKINQRCDTNYNSKYSGRRQTTFRRLTQFGWRCAAMTDHWQHNEALAENAYQDLLFKYLGALHQHVEVCFKVYCHFLLIGIHHLLAVTNSQIELKSNITKYFRT